MIKLEGFVFDKVGGNMKRVLLPLLVATIFLSKSNSQTVDSYPLQVVFKNMVDSVQLQLGQTYQNSFGENYTIRNFKYYISHISLRKEDGKAILFPGAYLVNEADSSTKTITIKVAERRFTAITFLLGVDSISNVSGTQTEDLDPAKGMFWTWNSGYIMAKLEATSPSSAAVNNNVTYHIGGFKTGQQTSRTITLQLPASEIKTVSRIVIEANANKWYSAVHNLKIADHAVCTTPGLLSVQYADNYAKMFTLAPVK